MNNEFFCPVIGRTFIRTGEYRSPKYQEYYETFQGSCQTMQADIQYYHKKCHIVKPKFPGDSTR